MSKKDERLDFKPATKDLLYRQAGGRCSVPRCKNPTMGPYYSSEGAVNVGVACHIYSAAENGPRGRGGKDDDFISSEKNGIWCCAYHSTLIDKKNGNDYPASVLFAWKKLAEARTLKQMNDMPSPLGWIDSIEFIKFANSKKPPKIKLSNKTILWGPNCSGKSSLIEIAASISNSRYGSRFGGTRITDDAEAHSPANFIASITYSTADALSKNIEIEISESTINRREGGTPYLLPPGDLEVIYCSSRDSIRKQDEDDIELFTRFLNIDRSALYAISKIGPGKLMPGEIRFTQATEYDEDSDTETKKTKNTGEPFINIEFKHSNGNFWVSYDLLSTSEQARLLTGLAITKANEISKQRLTLFLIDGLISNLDETNFKKLLSRLSEFDFQIAITLPPIRENNVLEFEDKKPKLKDLDYLDSWQLAILESRIWE